MRRSLLPRALSAIVAWSSFCTIPAFWARQLLLLVRRWWPDRAIVAVADSSYAALELLARCQAWPQPVTVITRLCLDAVLYEPAPARSHRTVGRPRFKGACLPTLAAVAGDPTTSWAQITVFHWYGTGARGVELVSDTAVWYHPGLPPVPVFATQTLLCTDIRVAPEQILAWFVRCWQLEVTFEEARRHLDIETQRQWSDLAIRRTTPALLGLFSLVTLVTHQHGSQAPLRAQQAAWYRKAQPTFADALAFVRRELWTQATFPLSSRAPNLVRVPRTFVERLTETLCYAA
jgi:hypothetical protein